MLNCNIRGLSWHPFPNHCSLALCQRHPLEQNTHTKSPYKQSEADLKWNCALNKFSVDTKSFCGFKILRRHSDAYIFSGPLSFVTHKSGTAASFSPPIDCQGQRCCHVSHAKIAAFFVQAPRRPVDTRPTRQRTLSLLQITGGVWGRPGEQKSQGFLLQRCPTVCPPSGGKKNKHTKKRTAESFLWVRTIAEPRLPGGSLCAEPPGLGGCDQPAA